MPNGSLAPFLVKYLLANTCIQIFEMLVLADCTNVRAYATLLRLSVYLRMSSVTLCIVAKWCVLEQKLLLTTYRKSHMRNRLVPK